MVESDCEWMKANTCIVEEYDTFVCCYNYNLLLNEILVLLILSVWFSGSHKSTQSKHPKEIHKLTAGLFFQIQTIMFNVIWKPASCAT